MDRVIFGDNQFFGVNHMSEEKARNQAIRFKNTKDIIKVLDIAYDSGIRTFMCTTHHRIADICDHFRANKKQYADFGFYPCMPYAHKYANAVTEYGILGALKRLAPGSILGTIVRGSIAATRRNTTDLMKLLVDAEMKMFSGLKVEVIFLQNVVTDMLMGLGMKEVFSGFAEYIRESYQAEPGFITMNLPRLVSFLQECGIDNPIVCSSINKIGFRMNPNKETCEKVIRERKCRPIAMSVLASGAIPPKEALEYIDDLKGVRAVVFGASTRSHILETISRIEKLSLPNMSARQARTIT